MFQDHYTIPLAKHIFLFEFYAAVQDPDMVSYSQR